MKVVLTRSHNVFDIGGINTYVWSLACELSKRDFTVHVISGCGNVYEMDKYWAEKFHGEAHTLKETNFISKNEQFAMWAVKGSRLIRQLKPDVVHFNGMVPFMFVGAKSVVTCHGVLNTPFTFKHVLYGKIAYKYFANSIIAVSRKVKDELIKHLKVKENKINIIPVGLDMNPFGVTPIKKRENAILCGWGRIKNPGTSLKVYHELKKRGLQCKLYVAGLSRNQALSSMPELAPLAQDKDIIFTGKLDRVRMIRLYQTVKCGLIPSFYESFSYGVLELFACGTPVVGSSMVAEEVIKPGHCSLIAEPEDYFSMSNHVSKLLTDEELWKKMSYNAQEHVKTFSIDRITDAIISVYHHSIDGEMLLHSTGQFYDPS